MLFTQRRTLAIGGLLGALSVAGCDRPKIASNDEVRPAPTPPSLASTIPQKKSVDVLSMSPEQIYVIGLRNGLIDDYDTESARNIIEAYRADRNTHAFRKFDRKVLDRYDLGTDWLGMATAFNYFHSKGQKLQEGTRLPDATFQLILVGKHIHQDAEYSAVIRNRNNKATTFSLVEGSTYENGNRPYSLLRHQEIIEVPRDWGGTKTTLKAGEYIPVRLNLEKFKDERLGDVPADVEVGLFRVKGSLVVIQPQGFNSPKPKAVALQIDEIKFIGAIDGGEPVPSADATRTPEMR